jgi:XTP/dITP diphosphohydrolase
MRPRLLIASSNPGKVREFRQIIADGAIDVLSPTDLGLTIDVDEDGTTYAENARLKAIAYAKASGLAALADDSGLEVIAFDGWPGVHSVRFAGPGADDADRRAAVLARLDGKLGANRAAVFVCAVAIADSDQVVAEGLGRLAGRIDLAPRGSGGFGYDPIFIPDGDVRTLGELTADEKNRISHRARAIAAIRPWLEAFRERRHPA